MHVQKSKVEAYEPTDENNMPCAPPYVELTLRAASNEIKLFDLSTHVTFIGEIQPNIFTLKRKAEAQGICLHTST